MDVFKRNINNIFFIFIFSHLIIWTLVPTITNHNLPLDTIEALAWGSNLDWGFSKHPPASAFFSGLFYQIFGAQDWAFYLLSQIFVCIAFIYVFKLANDIFNDSLLNFQEKYLFPESFHIPRGPWPGPCGQARAHTSPYGLVWADMDQFGYMWAHMGPYGPKKALY